MKSFSLQKQQPVYADIYHSTNPPAAPPPTELKPLVYAAVKQSTNSSDVSLPNDDIGHHVKMEAVQEAHPTSCKGQFQV